MTKTAAVPRPFNPRYPATVLPMPSEDDVRELAQRLSQPLEPLGARAK